MIILESFFQSTSLAKALYPVAQMMSKVDHCIFLNRNDLDIYLKDLKEEFSNCTKKMKSAYLDCAIDRDNNGIIYVYQKKSSERSDIRLYVSPIHSILEYDNDAKAFFDVSERIDEK